ncbi:MAG: hypothetical protein J6562_04540 [Candidatus Schmidhempelia sp.]|nr:hypothetical protein [Candidatus Schmidhempelia sp.]
MMNKKYILIIACLFLFACDNFRLKNGLQSRLDSIKNEALCYPLPKEINEFPIDIFSQSLTTELLDIFVDLNLLTKSELSLTNSDASKSKGWNYQLTLDGENYYQVDSNAFCFGEVIVDDIYEKYNIHYDSDSKALYYNYYYDNFPDWAVDKRFEKFYKGTEAINNQRLYSAKSDFHKYENQKSYTKEFNSDEIIKLRIN